MADAKISDLTAITGADTAADDDFVVVDTSAAQTKRITRDELRVGVLDGPHSSSTSSVALGTDALEDSSAAASTAIGVSALKENTTGARNTAVGNQALRDNTTAANSTAVGYNALALNNNGQNQAFGAFTLDANTTGTYNCAYGYASLGANVSGNYNVAVGGRGVLTSCVSGLGNVAVGGYGTLYSLDDGDYNVGIGYFAGQDLEGGSSNVLIGRQAGLNIVDADSNVCIGYISGNDISSGQVNTCVGFNAGNTLTTGSNNTLLGRDATPSAADVSNEITLGSSSVTALRVPGVDFYIDDGKVGIGTSSPSEKVQIAAGAASTLLLGYSNGAGHGYRIRSNVSTTVDGGFNIEYNDGTDLYRVDHDGGSGFHAWYMGGSERMRIDSSGNVGIGTSSSVGSNSTSEGFWFDENEAARFSRASNSPLILNRITTTGAIQSIRYNGAQVGSISVTASATAYNTSSDYRLKTDAQPMTGASARVQALNPVNFEWVADGTRVDGFLAHEAQAIVPESVTGTKDAMRDEEYEVTPAVLDEDGNEATPAVMGTRSVPDYQAIDQSKLVPLLTAALQEALTEINDLKARVTALEG